MQSQATIRLETVDIVFLVMVVDHCGRNEASSVSDDDLRLLYEQAYTTIDSGGQRPSTAAAAAIDRLRQNRLLARMDGGGLARAGSYALTVLGNHIVDFFVQDDLLDAESLSALLGQIHVQVVGIQTAAAGISTRMQWHIQVAVPLRTHVAALMQAIDVRSRALARTQEVARESIMRQIKDRWADEIVSYQQVLDELTKTISELREIAITGAAKISVVLDDIDARCRVGGAEASEASEACRFTMRHLEHLEGWARDTHEGWSHFFQHVQSYLRTVVQLDPGRVLESRLRDAARTFLDTPWALRVAHESSLAIIPPLRVLPLGERLSWDRTEETWEEKEARAVAELAPLVEQALAAGAETISAVVRVVLLALAPEERYAAIGRVSALLASRMARPILEEPSWVPIGDGIAIEDFPLGKTL